MAEIIDIQTARETIARWNRRDGHLSNAPLSRPARIGFLGLSIAASIGLPSSLVYWMASSYAESSPASFGETWESLSDFAAINLAVASLIVLASLLFLLFAPEVFLRSRNVARRDCE